MKRAAKPVLMFILLLSSTALLAQLQMEVEGGAQKTMTPSQFQQLQHQTLSVKNPHSNIVENYEGVPLRTLLDSMGVAGGEKLRGPELRKYILISAKDGYEVVLAIPEADPAFQSNQILVADKMDGKPLDEKNGPLKLVVPEDQRPARWVRMVTKISVRTAK
jgi:hypothetical protein